MAKYFFLVAFSILSLFQSIFALPVFYPADSNSTHTAKVTTLKSQGYRPISLNVHGPTSSPLYAAVWIKRTGPAWVEIHGVNGNVYQKWFDKYAALGYVSTIVTATGPIGTALYAGVMEKITPGPGPWEQRCGMTRADFLTRNSGALQSKRMLQYFDEFGTPADRRYCGVWIHSARRDKSTLFLSQTSPNYQAIFNTETTKPYWRPSVLSVSEDIMYSAVFTESSVGTSWVARHGLTAADLPIVNKAQNDAGRYIINLAAGGTGASARYAAIFAPQDIPSARTWRTTGTTAGFRNNAQASTLTENALKSFMMGSGVRQAQLSVSKGGVVLLNKAYTWSEPERSTTSLTGRFLLASLSKAFTSAAIQSLYNSHKIAPTTKAYPYLGYSCTSGDLRRCDITVQQLLDHTSGYDNALIGFDPTYNMRAIALAVSSGSHPATVREIVNFMFNGNYALATAPGAKYSYSNYGYLLLSLIVEKASGQGYFTYLQNTILTPEGLNVNFWRTSPSFHTSDNVIQESMYTGRSALQPTSPNPVAAIYGGDGMYKESAIGPASLASDAASLVKFIRKHAAWGNGGRAPGAARSGSTPGASTWMESRVDGVDWALVINTRDFPGGDADLTKVRTDITSWLNSNPVA